MTTQDPKPLMDEERNRIALCLRLANWFSGSNLPIDVRNLLREAEACITLLADDITTDRATIAELRAARPLVGREKVAQAIKQYADDVGGPFGEQLARHSNGLRDALIASGLLGGAEWQNTTNELRTRIKIECGFPKPEGPNASHRYEISGRLLTDIYVALSTPSTGAKP